METYEFGYMAGQVFGELFLGVLIPFIFMALGAKKARQGGNSAYFLYGIGALIGLYVVLSSLGFFYFLPQIAFIVVAFIMLRRLLNNMKASGKEFGKAKK